MDGDRMATTVKWVCEVEPYSAPIKIMIIKFDTWHLIYYWIIKKTVCEDFVLIDAAVAPVGTNGREKIWRKSQPAHDFSLFFLSSLLKFDFESSYKKQQILGKHKRFRNNFHT